MTAPAARTVRAPAGGVGLLAIRFVVMAGSGAAIVGSILRLAHDGERWLLTTIFLATTMSFLAMGWLIAERRRGNAVGRLILVLGTMLATYVACDGWVWFGGHGDAYAALVVSLLDGPMFITLALLFLRFPSGRLPGARWTLLEACAAGLAGLVLAGAALRPGPFLYYTELENPLPAGPNPITAAWDLLYGGLVACVAAAALSLIGRWRRAGVLERAQLKWAAWAAAIVVGAMTTYGLASGPSQFSDLGDLSVGIGLGLFPIAIGIAILRYRLFEIDRIISRTVSWTLTTSAIAGLFAVTVVVVQTAIAPFSDSDGLAVAISTLAAAAAFGRVRNRVQAVVDHRFNRARYDIQHVVDAFAEQLRGNLDLAGVTAGLVGAADTAVRPAAAAVWLLPPASPQRERS